MSRILNNCCTLVEVLALVGLFMCERVAWAAPGDLDPTFGVGGLVAQPFGSGESAAEALALQADGKIVIAGHVGTFEDALLARFNPGGTLDTSFGAAGAIVVPYGAYSDSFNAVTLQTDGKILAVGSTDALASSFDLLMQRYDTNGALDPTFGVGGTVTISRPDSDVGWAVLVQPDGKIVVAGGINGFNYDFGLWRFDALGAPDPTFGTAGVVITNIGVLSDVAFSVLQQTDGKLVAIGYSEDGLGVQRLAVARYETNGALDGGFGVGGVVVTPVWDLAFARAGLLQPDGKIVAVGETSSGGTPYSLLARYDPTGALDSGFGSSGIQVGGLLSGVGVARQGNGKLLVGATAFVYGNQDFAVARFDASGPIDTTFGGSGGSGVSLASFGPADNAAAALLQPDGRFVVAGRANLFGPSTVGIARFLVFDCGDGTPEPGEECDDGNTTPGDGCDTECRVETCFTCLGEPSVCTPEPQGVPCEGDGDLCTNDQCDGDGLCVALDEVVCPACETCHPALGCVVAPKDMCREPVEPFKALLLLKDSSDNTKDKLIWKWIKGDQPETGPFGDPISTDDYALCVYEGVGESPNLILKAAAPAGGQCAGRDCWKALSTKGFKYKDKELTPDGLDTIILKAGAGGKAKIIVKGKGENLGLPTPLDVELPVTVQLQSTNGQCWEAEYFEVGVKKNEAEMFKAKAGSPSGAFIDMPVDLLD